jgi:hypothetical protein
MAPKKRILDAFQGLPDESDNDKRGGDKSESSDDEEEGRESSDDENEHEPEPPSSHNYSNVDTHIHECKKSSCTRLAVCALGNNDPEYCIECAKGKKGYKNVEEVFPAAKDAASVKLTLNKLNAAFACFFDVNKECDVDDIKKIVVSAKRAAAGSRSTAKRAKT